MQMHRVNIGSMLFPEGVATWTQSLEAVDVHGELYVDGGHALIKATGQFHETLQQARIAAAIEIENTAQLLLRQASKLRSLGNDK